MYKVAKFSFTAPLLDLALQTKMTLKKVILLLELFSYHIYSSLDSTQLL